MNKKHLEDAFSHVSDQHIREAATYKRPRVLPYMSAIAACLVCAILLGIFAPRTPREAPSTEPTQSPTASFDPPQPFEGTLTPVTLRQSTSSALLSAPVYPQMAPYATGDGYRLWWDSQRQIRTVQRGYADNLTGYFKRICPAVLAEGGNAVFSPLNVYMALAMLAETSQGESRRQILSLLGTEDIAAVREQAEQVWRAHYNNDGLATSILGSALWLDDSYTYNESTVSTLTNYYYASVFRGDMGSAALTDALRQWLNDNTGNLLQNQVADVQLPKETALALSTTIYYDVQWSSAFYEGNNRTAVFHGTGSDTQTTFLCSTDHHGTYYWGDDFAAVSLALRDGSRMWLILPDQGKTPQDLLASGHALDMILGDTNAYPQKKTMIVHLSVPKFDITSNLTLKRTLQNLGVSSIFSQDADFSAILPDEENAYVDNVQHAARLTMAEDGICAAAYTLILLAGAAQPPTEEIDFTLDRPFLFVVESGSGLPIFAGTVNQP